MGLLKANIIGNIWYGEPFANPMIITTEFGVPRDNGVGYHTGIDLAPIDGQPGCPILFTDTGSTSDNGFFLKWVGIYHGSRDRDINGGYGNVLLGTFNSQGHTMLLAHLSRFSDNILSWLGSGYDPALKPTFSPGEVIAYQGNTGYVYSNGVIPADDDYVTATHTHMEIRDPAGNLLNPRFCL